MAREGEEGRSLGLRCACVGGGARAPRRRPGATEAAAQLGRVWARGAAAHAQCRQPHRGPSSQDGWRLRPETMEVGASSWPAGPLLLFASA